MEKKIKALGSLVSKHFSAHLDEVKLDSGRMTRRIKIDHPPAAAIVPFVDPEHLLMVKHWRYAVGSQTLEIPAGKADPGEALETCAHRELLEETGYQATHLISLFNYYPAIGYSNEIVHIFAAGGLVQTGAAIDGDEIDGLEQVNMQRFFELVDKGVIRDGKTVIGVCLFKSLQERGGVGKNFFNGSAQDPETEH